MPRKRTSHARKELEPKTTQILWLLQVILVMHICEMVVYRKGKNGWMRPNRQKRVLGEEHQDTLLTMKFLAEAYHQSASQFLFM